MGVYIPNWEKPKSCDECWAEYAYEICNSHSDCCPLVPVPTPHGRLIDANALMAKDRQIYRSDGAAIGIRRCIELYEIDDAPTIIEAEEGAP